MRIFHTSDWHIGRTFHGYSTLDAARTVLGAIPGLVSELGIDVVIVAGDVYDVTNPSAESTQVLQQAIVAIREAGALVVVLSGNHDSATKLGFAGPFSAAYGLHLLTQASEVGSPVELADEHGPVDIYGIPYLQPELMRRQPWVGEQARTQHDVVSAAMDVVRSAIERRGSDRRGSERRRSVVVAHTFVAGAESESSDSERAITREPLKAGGVDAVPVSVFEGVDYAALGHIHSCIQLSDAVRYSGALMHYSFKEAGKPRGGWLVDIGADGLDSVEWVDLPVPRPLKEITGQLNDLLLSEEWEPYKDHYVKATYTDDTKQMDPLRKLRTWFPWCAEVIHRPSNDHEASTASYRERVQGKSDTEVFESFLEDVRNGEGSSDEESQIFAEVLSEREAMELAK